MSFVDFVENVIVKVVEDFTGNAVLCVACVLILSFMREVPPKFEGKRIAGAGFILFIGSLVQRCTIFFAKRKANDMPIEPACIKLGDNLFEDLLTDAFCIIRSHDPNISINNYEAQKIVLIANVFSTIFGFVCICAGAFVLMRVFKAKHAVTMAGVQVLGFLLRVILENPYKILIRLCLGIKDTENIILFGYKGFAYGCYMIIIIVFYIMSTQQMYEVFWTKSVNVRKHILSLAALLVAYTGIIVLTNTIFCFQSAEKINPVIELIINIFLAIVLLPVPITTYYVTRAKLQNDFNEVKRKETIEKYDYSQKQNHELNDAMIKYIHDLPAHFMAIGEMASKMNAAEIAEYINELDKKLIETKGAFSTGNEHLDGLLNKELKNAEKNHVSIAFKGVFPPEGIKRFDITTVFINLIENAIEACKSVSGKREIVINSTMNGNRVYVDITNPFEHTIKKSRGKFETTKSDKEFHGYGIGNVAQVVESEKYDGTFSTEHNNNLFTASFDMRFIQ